MILPDLNLLLYAHRTGDPNHIAARMVAKSWWTAEEIGIPWSSCIGFIRLTTNPSAYDPSPLMWRSRVSIGSNSACRTDWRTGNVPPGTTFAQFGRDRCGRKPCPDAHIAAIALENNAEVHTNDRGFRRFPGLRWHNPLAPVNR